MNLIIDKETLLFGSFSKNPGNNGCKYFNNRFQNENINAIYKSYYSDNIADSFNAAKTLNFGGFAISMPFKFAIVDLVDSVDEAVLDITSANTVLIKEKKSTAYNTDWIAASIYLENLKIEKLTILGDGGFSKAVQYACKKIHIEYDIITRKNWASISTIENHIFNATPVDVNHKNMIDGRPHTNQGKEIALLQAEEQYKLYSKVF
jgi:shikimate 5-dehydrogenase